MCFTLSHPGYYSFNCPCWSDSTSYLCVSLSLTQGIQYNTTLLSLHREICLSGRFQLFHLITQPACCVICPILSVNHSLFSILAFTSSDTRYHSRFSILAFASSDTRYHSLFSILVFASSDARYHSRFSILAFASSYTRYHSLFSILVFASSDAR